MNTTYKQQIEAIRIGIQFLQRANKEAWKDQIAALNDAGSTIAALNLAKELPLSDENYFKYESRGQTIEELKAEIKSLIHHAEQGSITYSVLERARKLVFTHNGPNSVNH